jgi:hypothetical protein
MKQLLIELHYLAPVSYYAKLLQYDEIVFEQHENLLKSSYRNRCYIMGANGKLRLSIPLQNGRDHKALYTSLQTENRQRWKAIHWHSILSAYKHAPYFEHYAPHFEKLYLHTETHSLFQWNWQLFETTAKILKIPAAIRFSETFEKEVAPTIDDARNLFQPEKEPEIIFPKYIQVFSERHGFEADLSILDLIFNLGTEAKSYLTELSNGV